MLTSKRSIPSAGAALVILSLAMDTFVQQLANHTTRSALMNNTQATIPIAYNYSSVLDGDQASATYTMRAAIQDGIAAHLSGVPSTVPYSCPSDYCDYGSFTSLAVCSQCTEVTSSPNITNVTQSTWWTDYNSTTNWTAVWFEDAVILNDDQASWNSSTPYAIFNFSTSGGTSANMFTVLTAINMTDLNSISEWPASTFHTETCELYFCLKKITSSVRNGKVNETVEAIPAQNISGTTGITFTDSVSPKELFAVPYTVVQALDGYFNDIIGSQSTIDGATDGVWVDRIDPPYTDIVASDDPSLSLYHLPNLSEAFSGIATAMTQEIRWHADGAPVVIGRANSTGTIILVRWAWMILPAAIILLGGGFVIYTAWISTKH